jgi:uncharacterized protein
VTLAEREHALSGLRRVELALTETCNLACDYCHVSRNTPHPFKQPMPDGLMDATAQFVTTRLGADGVELVITGGEPLSYWPAVTYAVATFQAALGDRLRGVRLLTNGTLMRAERAAWLADHRIWVTLALDGPQSAHDAHRSNAAGIGSWRRATQGAAVLIDAGIVPDISMVVTRDTVGEAAAGIDWICETYHPAVITLAAADPPTPASSAPRPEPEHWAEVLVSIHRRWAGLGTRIEPIARVAEALRSHRPILHEDDGAWGGSLCVNSHGLAAPSLALLSAGIGTVPLESVSLDDGPFQQWRQRSPVHNPDCRDCPALGLCGNATMYASAAASGTPANATPGTAECNRGWSSSCSLSLSEARDRDPVDAVDFWFSRYGAANRNWVQTATGWWPRAGTSGSFRTVCLWRRTIEELQSLPPHAGRPRPRLFARCPVPRELGQRHSVTDKHISR